MVELPLSPDGVDLAGLDELAALLLASPLTGGPRLSLLRWCASVTIVPLPSTAGVRALDVDASAAGRSGDPPARSSSAAAPAAWARPRTAAALALRAAEEHGRRTVVLTIDPARRLAQSLGLTELDNTPRQVKGATPTASGGELHAMMLDMKRTFDEVVLDAHRPRAGRGDLRQPLLPGHELDVRRHAGVHGDGEAGPAAGPDEWDLIVVDTPPSRSALDFLDAPARLGRFLDGRMLRLLLAPARPAAAACSAWSRRRSGCSPS